MSLIAILLASLTGSPHCAGMCGGFVAFYSASSPMSILPHFLYNTCRGIVYVALGFIAGALGKAANEAGYTVGLEQSAAWLMGSLLCIWGISMLFGKQLAIRKATSSKTYFFFQKVLNSPAGKSPLFRSAAVGLLSVLLPCGWLYAFVAIAAASGNGIDGAAIMFVFWLGTLPVMAFLGGSLSYLGINLSKKMPKVTACLVIAAGLFAFLGKASILPNSHSHSHHHHMHHSTNSHVPSD